MRWILAALVLANVGLFMWGSWYKDPDQLQQPLARVSINPERMRLISDPTVKATLRPRQQHAEVKTLQPVKRVCHTVGSFETSKSAMRAGESMKKVGLEYSLRTTESEESRYQLYVPPLSSRKAAQLMQQKLSRFGFRDNALMFDKGMKNAVSVGIFKVKENANSLRRDLSKKGIVVKQRVLTSKTRRFWLDVPTDATRLAQLKGITWRNEGISVNETTCALAPGSASVK